MIEMEVGEFSGLSLPNILNPSSIQYKVELEGNPSFVSIADTYLYFEPFGSSDVGTFSF